MIDQVKQILQEALDKLNAVKIPELPRDGMTVRQALETLRATSDSMVCLKLEFESMGPGRPFKLEYAAYTAETGWTQDMQSLEQVLAAAIPKQPQPDALETVDSVLASVTEQSAPPF